MRNRVTGLMAGMLIVAGSAVAADGAAVYAKSCKTCHGVAGKGNAALAKALKVEAGDLDLTTAGAKALTDAQLADVVTKGKEKMKPVPKLKPDDVTAVDAYVRTLQAGGAATAPTAAAGVPGQATYLKTCKLCHGVNGAGNPKMAKTSLIGDETAKKSDEELIKVTTDGSADKKMPAYGKKLSADEIKAVVSYIRSLKK